MKLETAKFLQRAEDCLSDAEANLYQDNFRAVFELRQSGDYDLDFEPTKEDALFALESSSNFLSAVKQYLGFNT
jgi:uncharacterized protein (UPF0332 family)